jgi:hypothetical protein
VGSASAQHCCTSDVQSSLGRRRGPGPPPAHVTPPTPHPRRRPRPPAPATPLMCPGAAPAAPASTTSAAAGSCPSRAGPSQRRARGERGRPAGKPALCCTLPGSVLLALARHPASAGPPTPSPPAGTPARAPRAHPGALGATQVGSATANRDQTPLLLEILTSVLWQLLGESSPSYFRGRRRHLSRGATLSQDFFLQVSVAGGAGLCAPCGRAGPWVGGLCLLKCDLEMGGEGDRRRG